MRSLRVRLTTGLLVLAAAGLLTLGGITYAEQRSFLLDRIDQQLHAATGPISAALDGRPAAPPGGGGHFAPPGSGGPGFGLPPGTYGELRNATGTVIATTTVQRYGHHSTANPNIPAHLSAGSVLTVSGKKGDSGSYRVLASTDPDTGGLNVVAIPLQDVNQNLHSLLLVEGLVILGVLLVLGLLARVVVRVGLLPLERMGHTADAIAGGDLSHRVEPADERTEVGRLGIALNAMLERLERAFAGQKASEERLRRFLADASHELRTPLASIRGYAELFRIGAAREPAETEKAMRRIEQEAERMGVLVEDLLTLARLDELRDTEQGIVDLAALARDAVDDARATAPDRAIELHASGQASVLGDTHQLAQLLANLLRNALVHTPGGTPIEVRITSASPVADAAQELPRETQDVREIHKIAETKEVRLEVRDHGPGLPDGDPAALFERFWRAEPGRERGRAGAGLGLAIVSGVVERHGGHVQAANAAGGGASFVVALPLAEQSSSRFGLDESSIGRGH
jgi:two-component system, OmpR family, sensor kinase